MHNDFEYYLCREAAERVAVAAAKDGVSARVHLVLAIRYKELADAIARKRLELPASKTIRFDGLPPMAVVIMEAYNGQRDFPEPAETGRSGQPAQSDQQVSEMSIFREEELYAALEEALNREDSAVVWLIVDEIERREGRIEF